jgi:TetR/AcrR family transcriptional repressor of mexJK operon
MKKENHQPVRKTGRPTREEAARRQEELLDGALDYFLDHGFEGATIDGIAASVHMTKRTIYARYRDKASLFIAAVTRAVERVNISNERLATLDTNDLETTLTQIGLMRVNQVNTPEGLKLQRIINTESYRFPEAFKVSYEKGTAPLLNFLSDLFREKTRQGVLALSDPELAASIFMSMVVGGPVRLIVMGARQSEAEIDRRVRYAVHLFLAAAERGTPGWAEEFTQPDVMRR